MASRLENTATASDVTARTVPGQRVTPKPAELDERLRQVEVPFSVSPRDDDARGTAVQPIVIGVAAATLITTKLWE